MNLPLNHQKERSHLGIYLHIPFCVSKCGYCDFYSREDFSETTLQAYAERMCRELVVWSEPLSHTEISSVYLGGGTPSLLSVPAVEKLLQTIGTYFHLEPNAEISLEANPASLHSNKIVGYRQAGINRISVGAQSFLDKELQLLGRIHRVEDIEETVNSLCRGGIDNFNLDLIYGLPGQSERDFAVSLRRAVSLAPQHLSLYLLQMDAEVPLARRIAAGFLILPDDAVVSNMYYSARDFLSAAGYEHYEISNWAQPGYQCRHNLLYWHGEPYLGIGSSAVSFLYNQRWQAAPDYSSFMNLQRTWEDRVVLEELSTEDLLLDYLLMGLRLKEGIDKAEMVRRFGAQAWTGYQERLQECERLELLQVQDDRWYLSERGLFISNQVFVRLLS